MKICDERGYSLIEILVVIATLGILTAFAIPNYQQFRTKAFNTVAISDYSNIKKEITATWDIDDDNSNLIVLALDGPNSLPAPLDDARVSEDVEIDTLIRLNLVGLFDLRFLQLSHRNGDTFYRYTEINGDVVEQTFAK